MRNIKNAWRVWSTFGVCAVLGLAALAGCGGGGDSAQHPVVALTRISIQGSVDPATGQFTQAEGTFEKFTGTVLTDSTPDPTPFPPPEPGLDGSLFTGTYALNSGENGAFNFIVLPDNSAEGLAIPTDFFRFQTDPVSAETGTAVVSIQISGTTGSGTIRLSNGTQGTIKITGQTPVTAQFRALKRRLQGK